MHTSLLIDEAKPEGGLQPLMAFVSKRRVQYQMKANLLEMPIVWTLGPQHQVLPKSINVPGTLTLKSIFQPIFKLAWHISLVSHVKKQTVLPNNLYCLNCPLPKNTEQKYTLWSYRYFCKTSSNFFFFLEHVISAYWGCLYLSTFDPMMTPCITYFTFVLCAWMESKNDSFWDNRNTDGTIHKCLWKLSHLLCIRRNNSCKKTWYK